MRSIFNRLFSILFVCTALCVNAWGAEGDTHDFAQTLQQVLNNGVDIDDVTVPQQTYTVKKVIVTVNYNKSRPGATVSVKVGGTTFGSAQTINSSTTTTFEYENATAIQGSVVVSSTNNCTTSSGNGTFKITNVRLVEGPASGGSCTDPTTPLSISSSNSAFVGTPLTLTTAGGNGSAVTWSIVSGGSYATLSGSTLTPTAVGTVQVQASQGASGGKCGATITQDITISNAPINVTLSRNGSTEVINNVSVGTALDNIDGDGAQGGCDAWTFIGWSKSQRAAQNNSTPMDLVTTVDNAGPYYAVYRNGDGASVAFDPSTDQSTGTSITKSGITISTTSGSFSEGTDYRIYKGGTFTVNAGTNIISSITLSYSSSSYDGGGWPTNVSPNATSWSRTATSGGSGEQARITSLSVTAGTVYYSTTSSCGPKVQATASPWVTSTNGQFVKVEVPVTATNFDKSCTLSASVSGAGFSIVGWGANGNSVTKDVDLTTSLILAYNPSAYNTTADATITFSSNYSGSQTPVYSNGAVHGRSLPEKFVIAIKNGDQWYALPANMSGSNTYAGIAVNVDNTTNPTKVTAGPATALYSLLNVYKTSGSGDRYADYGTRVRFLGNEKCLWSNAANNGTGINNGAIVASATSDNYEWTLVTTDGITYAINTNVAKKIEEGRELRYYAGESRFGMYTSGNSSFRFLPVDCDNRATVTEVDATYNTVTLTWTGKSGTDYNVYIDEGGATKKTETNVTSPVTITGLSSETNYTWIISPGVKDAECALSGAFTTNVAPIHVSLSCDGTVYNLGPQDKPYTLPTTGAYVADACTEWTFVGWTNGTYSKNSSAPTLITQMTADGTAYAVYKKTEAGSASGSLTMTGARTTGGGYNTTYSETEYTTESDAITIESNNIINNTSYIQLKAGTGNRIYNTTAMPGNITQITVTATTNDAYVYVGSSAVGSGSSALTPTSGSTSGTAVYTIPAGNTYFAIGATGSYVVVSSIEVEYSSSTSYYATSSECCNEVAPPTVVVEPLDVSATISWDNQSGATNGYHVTCSNGTDQDVAAGVTSLVINGLSALTTYTYTVTAKGTTCNRAVEGSFETASCANVPTNVNVNPGTHSATISWMQTTGTTATVVIYDDDLGTNIVKSVANQTSPCVITGLNDNTDYWLQVFANGTCPHPLKPFTTNTPTVELVEWFPDSIRIVLDADENTASVLIEDKQEQQSGTTSYADGLFFSKYYEAYRNVKLWAIYNGTAEKISLANVVVKSANNGNYWGKEGTTSSSADNAGKVTRLDTCGHHEVGYIYPGEEIIVYNPGSESQDEAIITCMETAYGKAYTENPDSVWYLVRNQTTALSGDDGLILLDGTDTLDVIGGKNTAAAYTKKTKPTWGDANGWTCDDGEDVDGNTLGLSTNRCLLVRKNTVKSGLNAVANNTDDFYTLCEEWWGAHVPDEDNDALEIQSSCDNFSYVGHYDYNAYYAHFDSLTTVDELSGNKREDGTINIPIPQLDTLSCTMLRVKVYEGDVEKASKEYKVPIMVEDSKTTNDTIFKNKWHDLAVCQECDVVILKGATLTKTNEGANDASTVRNLTIYPGGTMVVPSGRTFNVASVQFRVEGENVPVAKLQGTLNSTTQQVIVTRRQDNKRPYFFSLPYDCNVSDVRWSNGEVPVLGTDYRIMTYDGATRAAQGSANNGRFWTYLTSSDVIRAGVGYNIQTPYQYLHELVFPMTISAANLTDEENNKSITTAIHQYTNPGTTINNHNWNLIAQPYISPFTPQTDGDIQYGYMEYRIEGEEVIWERKDATNVYLTMPSLGDDKITYDQRIHNAAGLTLAPFMACFVQGAGEGDITFDKTHRILSAAPARHLAAETEYTDESIFVGVTLSTNGKSDQTNVRLRPDFTNEYKLGYDLDKFITYYTARPQIYMVNGSRMAFRAVSDEIAAEQAMQMGVYGEYAGTYTFALSEDYPLDHVEAVYLIDVETGRTTNLLYDTYSFTTSGRIYTESRFKLKVVVHRDAPQTPTDIETVVSGAQQTQKIIYNGQLYILHDGKIYDATGKQLFNR